MMLLKEILLLKNKLEQAYLDFTEQSVINYELKKEIAQLKELQEVSVQSMEELSESLTEVLAENKSLKDTQSVIKVACLNLSKDVTTISKDLNLISLVLSQILSGRPYTEIILDINKMLVEENNLQQTDEKYEEELDDTITDTDFDTLEDSCQEFNSSCNYIYEFIDDEKPKCIKKVYH